MAAPGSWSTVHRLTSATAQDRRMRFLACPSQTTLCFSLPLVLYNWLSYADNLSPLLLRPQPQ